MYTNDHCALCSDSKSLNKCVVNFLPDSICCAAVKKLNLNQSDVFIDD